MTKSEMKCKKCGCDNVFIQTSGNNVGLYCSDCGKWIKWLNKDEQRVAERRIENYVLTPPTLKELDITEEDELMFVGMNITEAVLDAMLKIKKNATQGMTKRDLKAYEMGISNALAYLQVILNDNEHCVVNTYGKAREYTYEDLKKYFSNLGLQR